LIGWEYVNYTATGTSDQYVDDVYIDDTWQRVEIGDNATYSSCTHREIQIPTAWSDTSITATLNQGSFENGSTGYVFVIDEDGNANETGKAITFGEAPAPEPSGKNSVINIAGVKNAVISTTGENNAVITVTQ
jgi:hypothetical protein